MKWFQVAVCSLLFFFLTGCQDSNEIAIAEFNSADIANKVLVLLDGGKIDSKLVYNKGLYSIYVYDENVMAARALLSNFNFYFETEDLNDLLESKFSSLSKLENIKSNLLEGKEIYNKLNVIPGILRASVMVTGNGVKRVSVLLISYNDIDNSSKVKIEKFLKGVVSENDTLNIEYLVQPIINSQ